MELRIRKIILDGIEHCNEHIEMLRERTINHVSEAEWNDVISTAEEISILDDERKVLLRQLGNL